MNLQVITDELVMMKKCSKCKRLLETKHFHKDSTKPDGLFTICRDCRAGRISPPVIPSGYRMCRICDAIKPTSEYYKQDGISRRTCIDCCKKQWNKIYRPRPEARRRHYELNREKEIEVGQRWRGRNPNKVSEYSRRRRVKVAGSIGSHTEEEWQVLCSYYMDQCLSCGNVPDRLTRDHVVPLSMGGSDDISNIQPLCVSCNSRKNAKVIDYRG